MKEEHRYKQSLLYIKTRQPGPAGAWEKFDELMSPIWTFFVKQSFFSSDLFRFWSLEYPGSGGRFGRVILVLKTFPELAGRSVQNLVEIGLAVCM